MKQIISFTLMIAVFFTTNINVFAAELSGRVLNALVNDVTAKFKGLDEQQSQFKLNKNILKEKLQKQKLLLDKEKSPVVQEAIIMDIEKTLIDLNSRDIDQVAGTVSTLVNIMPKLKSTMKELSNLKGDQAHTIRNSSYKSNVSRFMKNTATILGQLKKRVPDKHSKSDISSLESTLLVYAHSLKLSQQNTLSFEEIKNLTNLIEESIIRLLSVRKVLEKERSLLQAHNYVSIAKLLNFQLGKGKSIIAQFNSFQNDIDNRFEILKSLDKKGINTFKNADRGDNVDSILPASDELLLEQIKNNEYLN